MQASVVAVQGLICPGPGIEHTSSALAGGFFTTDSQGSPK